MNMEVNRRSLLAGTGALTVSVLLPGQKARAQTIGAATRPPLDPRNLSSYVTIKADGGAICYWGKMDMGQGTDLGTAQMVAEELDLPIERVEIGRAHV